MEMFLRPEENRERTGENQERTGEVRAREKEDAKFKKIFFRETFYLLLFFAPEVSGP